MVSVGILSVSTTLPDPPNRKPRTPTRQGPAWESPPSYASTRQRQRSSLTSRYLDSSRRPSDGSSGQHRCRRLRREEASQAQSRDQMRARLAKDLHGNRLPPTPVQDKDKDHRPPSATLIQAGGQAMAAVASIVAAGREEACPVPPRSDR